MELVCYLVYESKISCKFRLWYAYYFVNILYVSFPFQEKYIAMDQIYKINDVSKVQIAHQIARGMVSI